ncbi:hypothetical protein EIQ02_07250, partial [Xanthomonas campestris pv. raphani]
MPRNATSKQFRPHAKPTQQRAANTAVTVRHRPTCPDTQPANQISSLISPTRPSSHRTHAAAACESRIPNPESRIPIPDSPFPIPHS